VVAAFGADHVLWGSNFRDTFGKSPATAATYAAMLCVTTRCACIS